MILSRWRSSNRRKKREALLEAKGWLENKRPNLKKVTENGQNNKKDGT